MLYTVYKPGENQKQALLQDISQKPQKTLWNSIENTTGKLHN